MEFGPFGQFARKALPGLGLRVLCATGVGCRHFGCAG